MTPTPVPTQQWFYVDPPRRPFNGRYVAPHPGCGCPVTWTATRTGPATTSTPGDCAHDTRRTA